jgi:arachidonate 15-lipoxygenase
MPSFAPPSEYDLDFANPVVPGVPMPRTLPDEEARSPAYRAVENSMRGRLIGNALLSLAGVRPWSRPADFARVWRIDPPSPVTRTWASDTEFARQRLAGMEPTMIRRLRSADEVEGLPSVPEHTIERQLGTESSLAALVEAGRVFVCDYRHFAGLSTRRGRFMPAPIAWFAWSTDRPDRPARLMPLAIRLGQTPADPVFLPDAGEAWQVAKLMVQAADGTHGDMWSHLVQSHFAATPFVVATKRKLPVGHPVRTILEPHMQFTLYVNSAFAKGPAQFLYGQLMPFDHAGQERLIQSAWADFHFEDKTFLRDLALRGVEAGPELPRYPYRDDAALLWEPTRTFVRDVLEWHYPDDASVALDRELAAWLDDLRTEGRVRGLPEGLETREALVHVVANVLFHFGPKHAGVHSPAADYGIFAPNVTNTVWQEPPRDADDIMHLVQYLPGRLRCLMSFALHYAISEVHFGQFAGYSDGFAQALARPESSWPSGYDRARLEQAERQLATAGDALTFALVKAERTIVHRNAERRATLDGDYPFLLPSRIPNSIYA